MCKIVPNDREAQNKLKTAQKEYKAILFAECLDREAELVVLNPEDIVVPESYSGPVFP